MTGSFEDVWSALALVEQGRNRRITRVLAPPLQGLVDGAARHSVADYPAEVIGIAMAHLLDRAGDVMGKIEDEFDGAGLPHLRCAFAVRVAAISADSTGTGVPTRIHRP